MKQLLAKVYKWFLLETVCFLIVTIAISAVPYIEKVLIESLESDQLTEQKALMLVVAFVAVVLCYLFFNYIAIVFAFKGSAEFEREVRNKCFSNYLKSGSKVCTEEEKDQNIQAMTTEIGQLDVDLIRSYVGIVQSILQIIVFVTFIFFFINREIAGIALCLGAFGVFLSRVLETNASQKREAYLHENKLYIGFLRHILSGLSIIRQNNLSNILEENRKRTRAVEGKRMLYGRSKALLLSLSNGISYFTLLLFFICVVVLAYFGQLTVAIAVISFGYIDLLMEPINSIFSFIATLKSVQDLKKKFDLMLADTQGVQYDSTEIRQIAVEKLSCSVEEQQILRPITEVFDSQKQHLIVGANGSGKSTLLKILSNIMQPTDGSMTINQSPVSPNVSYNDLYYVAQEAIVFPTSFTANVTVFGAYEIDRLKHFQFYHTPIAQKIINCEDCQVLSGGEKQFLSLCRAIISGARWLLLDESFSNLSASLEKSILQELVEKGYHIIYITHGDQHLHLFQNVIHVKEPDDHKNGENKYEVSNYI